MKVNFQISGIEPQQFASYFQMNSDELSKLRITKMIVDEKPGFPCRVSLQDAEVGEEVILLPFEHHNVSSPYRASGPIFIRKNALEAKLKINEIPEILPHRFLSLRIYDKSAMMIDARTLDGEKLSSTIENIFENPRAEYIHVHNANPGCYNCQIDRVN